MLVLFGDYSDVVRSHEYSKWVSAQDEVVNITDFPSLYSYSTHSLFQLPPSFIITVEYAKASELREAAMFSEDNDVHVLIVASKKPQGKFDGSSISIMEVKPRSGYKWLAEGFSIPLSTSRLITHRVESSQSAEVLARQASLLGRDATSRELHYLYDPFKGDTPPWDITNSIQSGDPASAVKYTRMFLQQKSASPQSLCMQLTGFYRKLLTEKKNWFFVEKRKQLRDVDGMIADMSFYPQRVLSAGKDKYVMYSYVASLASRF